MNRTPFTLCIAVAALLCLLIGSASAFTVNARTFDHLRPVPQADPRSAPIYHPQHESAEAACDQEFGCRTLRRDVCVLGAGPSGLTTAAFVKDNGGTAVVLETANAYGGNCDTVPQPGQPSWIDIGTVAFSNTTALKALGMEFWGDFDSVFQANRFSGGRVIPIVRTPGATRPTVLTNFYTGETYDYPYTQEEYDAAFARLFDLVKNRYPWFDPAVRPSPIPDELLLPFSSIIRRYRLEPLVPTLFPNSVGGIADYHDVLALYALIDLKSALLYIYTLNNTGFVFNGGCITMYNGIVDYIGRENVLLGVKYLDVERGKDRSRSPHRYKVRVGGSGNGGRGYVQNVECSATVVAFPENLETIAFLDPDREERKAFEGFRFRYWAAIAANVTGPLPDSLTGYSLFNRDPTQPFGVPEPPCVQSIGRGAPRGLSATYVTSKHHLSTPEAVAIWYEQTANISTEYVTGRSVEYIEPHAQYQPHAPACKLASNDNVYARIRRLNAKFHRNTLHRSTTSGDNDSALQWFYANTAARQLKALGVLRGVRM